MTPAEHIKAIERAVEIYSRDFAIYCDTQALTDFRVCSVSLAALQGAIQAGVGAPAQPAAWPRNAAEVREFMDAHCQREEYANDDTSPSDDDLYVLTAYNFLSAVNSWADSPHLPGATQPPAQAQDDAVAQAVAAEREACAQLAAQTACDLHVPTGIKIYGTRAAKAIRARGTDEAKPAAPGTAGDS